MTATENQAKRYINIALHDMHVGQGEKFSWAERRAVLITKAEYTTGTVAIAQGDTALTGTSTAWDTANAFGVKNMVAGGKIVINGGDEVYEIASVTDDTNAVLASDFIKSTETAASYVYFEDEYALAQDFLRPIDQQSFDEGCSIDLIGRTEFRRRFPRNKTPGKPHTATMIDTSFAASETGTITTFAASGATKTTVTSAAHGLRNGDQITISGTTSYNGGYLVSNVVVPNKFDILVAFVANDATGTWVKTSVHQRRLKLAPPPSDAYAIPYAYVTANLAVTVAGAEQMHLETDTDEPIIPVRYRHAIVYHALANWLAWKQDDARSQEAANEYTKIMLRIVSDNEIGGARPQIRPRVAPYRSRARRPWDGGGRRYDLNGKFDRLEW
jgi:hypothetical protein